jgi:hypothetical protein
MENLLMVIGQNQNLILMFCMGSIIVLLFLIILLIIKNNKLQNTYNFLVQGKENINIEDVLTQNMSLTRNNEVSLVKLAKEVSSNAKEQDEKIIEVDKLARANSLENKLELDEKFSKLYKELIEDNKILKEEFVAKYNEVDANMVQNKNELKNELELNINEVKNTIKTNKDTMSADYNEKINNLDRKWAADSAAIKLHMRSCLQKVDLKRYDAFDNITGEQSFTTALLDADGNGIVISSLYGREDNRSYGKKIVNGKGLIKLSREEETMVKEQVNQ